MPIPSGHHSYGWVCFGALQFWNVYWFSSLHSWHIEGKAGGVVQYTHLYRGSGCLVTLEKPNADLVQQVAAFPQEREELGFPKENWFGF